MTNEQFIQTIFQHLHPDKPVVEQIEEVVFDYVDSFVQQNDGREFAELVFQLTRDSSEWWKIGCLLDILIWSTADNGTQLINTTRNWFLGDDVRKIRMSLWMTNVRPMEQPEAFIARLEALKALHPALAGRCDYWLEIVHKTKMPVERRTIWQKMQQWLRR